MPPAPEARPPDFTPSRWFRAALLLLGIWVIGVGSTLVFGQHVSNPFAAITAKLSLIGLVAMMGCYAAALAGFWAAIARFESKLMDEFVFTGTMIVGGVFAPHALCFIADLIA